MNLSKDNIDKLKGMAADVAKREGCVLYSLDASAGKVLRIFIEKYDAEKGASLEDCSNVSKGLSFLLDADEVMGETAYNLEVSTPGIERFLSEPWHYEKALNSKVKVSIKAGFEVEPPEGVALKKPVKSLKGEISAVNEDSIDLMSNESCWKVPFSHVHSAKTIYEFNNNTKKTKR